MNKSKIFAGFSTSFITVVSLLVCTQLANANDGYGAHFVSGKEASALIVNPNHNYNDSSSDENELVISNLNDTRFNRDHIIAIRGYNFTMNTPYLTDLYNMPVRFIDNLYVPYIALNNIPKVLSLYIGQVVSENNNGYSFTQKDHIYKVTNKYNNAYFTLDAQTGIFSYTDRLQFFNVDDTLNDKYHDPLDFTTDVSFSTENQRQPVDFITEIIDDKYIIRNEFKGNLANFNLMPKTIDNTDYLPFKVVMDLLKSSYENNYVYNGDKIYQYSDVVFSGINNETKINSYRQEFAYGWSIDTNDKNFLNYAYNELCFNLSQNYGLVNNGGYEKKDFYACCQQLGIDDDFLRSGDDFNNATATLIGSSSKNGGLADGGHTALTSVSVNYSKVNNNYMTDSRTLSYFDEIEKYNEQRQKNGIANSDGNIIKGEEFQFFDAKGNKKSAPTTTNNTIDTIFYTFDEFTPNQLPEMYYLSYYANMCKNLKHVVLDISCNGGGIVYTVPYILSTINGGKCEMKFKDPITGSTSSINCKTGINFHNGYDTFDESNYLPKGVTPYIMTSPCSFSCGNMLPAFAQCAGIKTIGKTSGGGACVVAHSVTCLGSTFQHSGNAMACVEDENGNFNDIDNGIAPNISLNDYSEFYNRSNLVTHVLR